MKIQVRNRVFETNSSSMHTFSYCDDDTYQAWERGELLYNVGYDDEIPDWVTPEEAQKYDPHYPYPPIEYGQRYLSDREYETEDGEYEERIFLTLEEYFTTIYYNSYHETFYIDGKKYHAFGEYTDHD